MSTAKSSAGERKVLARYEADEGERQLVAQRINGRVALSDVPAGEQGRVHLVERHLGALEERDALVEDYLVRRGQVFGRSERRGGIEPFDRLVWQVMTKEPYASARTVYWIVDNGSSHRGQASIERLESRWPNLRLIHLPVHASWLNQVEIYFSIVQRKLLQPNDFESTAQLARALNDFEHHYNAVAKPFDWEFTRDDLAAMLARLAEREPQLALAA